jgi:hypothetical protein
VLRRAADLEESERVANQYKLSRLAMLLVGPRGKRAPVASTGLHIARRDGAWGGHEGLGLTSATAIGQP